VATQILPQTRRQTFIEQDAHSAGLRISQHGVGGFFQKAMACLANLGNL